MSGEMDTSTNVSTIYIPLRNEGTAVFRPTLGIRVGKDVFQVLPTAHYDAGDEEWEFPPGSIVECVIETREGKEVLLARRQAPVP